MIDTKFSILFKIELLHKYFSDGLCKDFIISPSLKSLRVLSGHEIIAKQYGNELYAGIQSDGNKPSKPIDEGLQMTFFLQLNNPLFFNYTNLPFTFSPGKIYYFTNRNNNTANGKDFLSSKIMPYNSSTTYKPGDMATNSSGTVFSAIRTNDLSHQFDLSHTDYWMQIDNNQFMSESDALQLMPSVSTYNFSSLQSSVNISVSGYNSATADYSKPVLSKAINFPTPASSFTLDLSMLEPGKYSLTVNGTQQWIYINDELNADQVFGVVDIFNETTPASCNLVDGSGNLLSPLYSVFFLNRATIWKYFFTSTAQGTIDDTANVYQFANPGNPVTSVSPIPLSDKALKLKLTMNGLDHAPIACADPKRITSLTQSGDTYPCSEIYLNF